MENNRREDLLKRIIAFEGDVKQHISEISKFGWDSDREIVALSKEDIEDVLRRLRSGEISNQQLDDWANFIECREDIGFEESMKGTLREIIHWLANPNLGYEVNPSLLSKIDEALTTNAL